MKDGTPNGSGMLIFSNGTMVTGSFRDDDLPSSFGGVGVVIHPVAEGVVIVAVLPDTPACSAGLKSGDIITEVDSKPLAGLKIEQVVRQMRGAVGSEVVLTISPKGQVKPLQILRGAVESEEVRKVQVEPLKMMLVRKEIPVPKKGSICKQAADKSP